jgi:hypothetical protein
MYLILPVTGALIGLGGANELLPFGRRQVAPGNVASHGHPPLRIELPEGRVQSPSVSNTWGEKLNGLIAVQVDRSGTSSCSPRTQPTTTRFWALVGIPVLYVRPTAYRYDGDADPSRPGRHLLASFRRREAGPAGYPAAIRVRLM